MHVILSIILVFLLASAGEAQTTITLRSGAVVQGKILQETVGFIKVEAYGVPLTIYRDEIAEVSSTVTEVTVEQITPEGRQVIIPAEPMSSQPPGPDFPAETLTVTEADSPPPEGTTIAEKPIVTRKITVDGLAQDWDGIPVTIEDVAGDIKKEDREGAGEAYDVEAIRLSRDRDDLLIQIVFTKNLVDLFKANAETPQLIGTFLFDADQDALTGGKESFTGQGGFESQLNLWARLVRDSGREAPGETHYFEMIINVHDPSENFLDTAPSRKIDALDHRESFAWRDRTLEIQIPAEDLALSVVGGAKARILFREEGGGQRADDEEAFSPPVSVSF